MGRGYRAGELDPLVWESIRSEYTMLKEELNEFLERATDLSDEVSDLEDVGMMPLVKDIAEGVVTNLNNALIEDYQGAIMWILNYDYDTIVNEE